MNYLLTFALAIIAISTATPASADSMKDTAAHVEAMSHDDHAADAAAKMDEMSHESTDAMTEEMEEKAAEAAEHGHDMATDAMHKSDMSH